MGALFRFFFFYTPIFLGNGWPLVGAQSLCARCTGKISAKVCATDPEISGDSRSREVHGGTREKASFMENRLGPGMGFRQVEKSKDDRRNT